MSSYGLTCEFPVEELAALTDLESLDLSANFDLTVGGCTAAMFSLHAVQHCWRHLCAHQGLMLPQLPSSCSHAKSQVASADELHQGVQLCRHGQRFT